MLIYGPTRKTSTQNVEASTIDHSVYVRKTGSRMTGRINMGGKKITSLAEPTEDQDAATARYVSQYVSHLNNVKVSKDGDTMTGPLDHGCLSPCYSAHYLSKCQLQMALLIKN